MNFTLNEDVLRKALLLELEERMEKIPPSFYEPHVFSKRYRRKMRKLEKRVARPRPLDNTLQIGKRLATVLLVAIIACLTAIMCVASWREQFFRFVEQKFYRYSVISYESVSDGEESVVEQSTFIAYNPAYIPKGFKLLSKKFDNFVHLYYSGPNKTYISFRQVCLTDEKGTLKINTEGVELEPVVYKGHEAYFYRSKNGDYSLLWNDGTYSFLIGTNTDRETLFKVADSVRLK